MTALIIFLFVSAMTYLAYIIGKKKKVKKEKESYGVIKENNDPIRKPKPPTFDDING